MKKKNRVKKHEEFQKVIHSGKKCTNHSFVLYVMKKKEEEGRIGITLSKKMGNAVKRNLIKRQVRMMCQDLVDFEKFPFDAVIIVRLVTFPMTLNTIKIAWKNSFQRLQCRSYTLIRRRYEANPQKKKDIHGGCSGVCRCHTDRLRHTA